MQVAPSFDTLGAFGKSALDVASACDAMRTTDIEPTLAAIASSVSLSDVTVGFVDIDKWRLPAHTQSGDPEYYEQTVSHDSIRTSPRRETLLIQYYIPVP